MWSQENMKHEYEICAALNKEKHQVVNFLWQHPLKWIGQCVPRMTSDTSESSEVFRAVIICVFKRPLTSSFYWSSSSCWIKLVNHPANQVTDLKTAEQWGLLSQRKVSLSLWWGYLSCPAAPEWAQPPRAPCTAYQTVRNRWHPATGRGRRRRMKAGVKQTFRNISALSKALPKFDSMQEYLEEILWWQWVQKNPIKWTLPRFADTSSKIALEVEPTLNISLLLFIQRYL